MNEYKKNIPARLIKVLKKYVRKRLVGFCHWLNSFSFWIQKHVLEVTLEADRAARNLDIPLVDMDQDLLAMYIRWNGHHLEKTVRNNKGISRGFSKPLLLRKALDEWYRRGYPCCHWIEWAEGNLEDYKKWNETGLPQIHYDKGQSIFQPSSPIMDVLKNRVSTRIWKATPVEEEKIQAIIQTAAYAPTSCNRQPWKLYVRKNSSIIEELAKSDVNNKALLEKAPVIIYITIDNRLYPEIMAPALDAGIIGLQLSLAAAALGLGGCLMYGCENFDQDEFRRQYNIPSYRYMYLMYLVGYAAERTVADKRVSIEEVSVFV